jgi:hypothetical protein
MLEEPPHKLETEKLMLEEPPQKLQTEKVRNPYHLLICCHKQLSFKEHVEGGSNSLVECIPL